jgi:hypothetical protein
MAARWIGVAVACAVMLTACPSTEGAAVRRECVRHSLPVAQGRDQDALRSLLLSSVLPSARSLEPKTTADGRRVVRLLNDEGSTVIKVNVWQKPDGTWVARRRSECYRSADGGCVSHRFPVARSIDLRTLRREVRGLLPAGRSLGLVTMKQGRRSALVLDEEGRGVAMFHIWPERDGSWVAGRMSRCFAF